MRRVELNPVEANLVFTSLNFGDPQRGLTVPEIRDILPVLDKMEKHSERTPLPQGGEKVTFFDMALDLKESEYNLIRQRLENSGGWASAVQGRAVIALIDKLKEVPQVEEPKPEKPAVTKPMAEEKEQK